MPDSIRVICFECMTDFTVPSDCAGANVPCTKTGCGGLVAVPQNMPSVNTQRSVAVDKPLSKKGGDIPTGAAGLVLTVVFCVWIAASPGGLYSVFLGGTLGTAGLVICIIGLVKRSGSLAGVIGIFVYILGWVLNDIVFGRR